MVPRDDSPNPRPDQPTGSGSGGGSEPAPEPIVIPPDIVTYSEPDIGVSFDISIDMNIKTGKE